MALGLNPGRKYGRKGMAVGGWGRGTERGLSNCRAHNLQISKGNREFSSQFLSINFHTHASHHRISR